MALSILDGNQSATTLSTILSSGQHITAHTVVSLGTQAITDMRGAVSGSVVSISNLPATQTVAGSVEASNLEAVLDQYETNAQEKTFAVVASLNVQGYVSDSAKSNITNSVTIGSLPAISGTVTANVFGTGYNNVAYSLPVGLQGSDAVTRGIGIGFHEDLTADEFRIVKASGPFPVQVRAGTVTIGSLPAISGTVTANTFALQGTAVTTSNFTSTTASTVLANFNATREVLTIFNEGAGNLHICAGATCTTIAYQVRLSSGDYYEVPNHQTSLTHSAVFATAGTARVTEVS